MEFTHIGLHCDVQMCNQQDFLPFHCDVCKKTLCLAHRTYAAHDCDGQLAKDITSLDCPICLQAVKFNRSQNADAVWSDHYMNNCSQKAAPLATPKKKCNFGPCRNLLGPSNTFHCARCNNNVCLSHRMPEEHACTALQAGIQASTLKNEAFLAKLANIKRSATSSGKQGKSGKATATATAADQSNTLKGSAQRRMNSSSQGTQGTSTSGSGSSSVKAATSPSAACVTSTPDNAADAVCFCPLCGFSSDQPDAIVIHVDTMHSDVGASAASAPAQSATAPTNNNNSNNSHTLKREVCPVCQARFSEAVELVMHFESTHNQSQQATSAQATGGSGSNNNNDHCSLA